MANINVVVLSGNLTGEPEIRTTASGFQIMNFSIGSTERRRNSANGEWDNYTNFAPVAVFGNRIPYLSERLHKGTHVVITGTWRSSTYKDKTGTSRTAVEIIARDVEVYGSKTTADAEASTKSDSTPEPDMAYADIPF